MEIQYEKYDQTDKDYFKLGYNNQDVTGLSEFKKWYEKENEIYTLYALLVLVIALLLALNVKQNFV